MRLSHRLAMLCLVQTVSLVLFAAGSTAAVLAKAAPTRPAAAALDAEMAMPAIIPPDCSGYPEPRTFLEVQAWWKGANTPNGRAHLHAGTCFPLGQKVSGKVRFDIRVIMHNNPGRLFSLSAGVFGGQDRYLKLDKKCQDTCTWWFTMTVDTRSTLDGWHEFRFKPRVRFHNGKRMMTSTGWPAFIDNGVRSGDEARPGIGALVARGWYEGEGYQNPQLENAWDALRDSVHGLWTPEVKLDRGAQGFRPTTVAAYIDPDFHMGDPGMIILSRSRPYRGELEIHTRRLANGWHRLVLRVTAWHNDRQNSGIEVIYFNVAN